MTIDEAIAHEKMDSEHCSILCTHATNINDCIECRAYHKQVYEWLKELKAYKSDDFTKNLQTLVYKQGYNKAIDDFVNQFNVIVDEKCGTDTNNYFRKIVKEVAEQLKESETK